MKSFLQRSALTLTAVLSLAATGFSQCNNPSSAGVVICTPTTGSTVVATPMISVRSTPAQGAAITEFIIYDNNQEIDNGFPGMTGVDLIDGAIFNGNHNIVVNAWDTDGNLYQAKTSFYVTGEGYAPCTVPNSLGVVICNPPPSGIYGTGVTVDAAAKGKSAIKTLSFYLNGTLVQTVTNNPGAGIPVQLPEQGVSYTLKVIATDSSGDTYSATKTLNAAYTYSLYSCDQQCPPGINVVAPQPNTYVGNTFNLDMQIIGNPKPITAMKAYIDDSVVATSTNANLQQEISSAPNGTHILTVQGWDDSGTEYRIQENININVDE